MGMYDYISKDSICIQFKGAECIGNSFLEGDLIDVRDGIYLAYEGAFVVKDGRITSIVDEESVYNKWGGKLNLEKVLNLDNPMAIVSTEYPALKHFGLI